MLLTADTGALSKISQKIFNVLTLQRIQGIIKEARKEFGMKTLYGITVAMVTPFTDEDTVDIPSLEKYTEYLIEAGVNCLYPCGSTGEMSNLTEDERKLVVETVVKSAAGRIPVFAQVGTSTTAGTIRLAQHAVKCGADGIGVVTPWYMSLSDKELEEYYVTIAKSVPDDFSVYLYGIPQCAANDITPSLATRIAERCKNVVGIKYSSPDIIRMQKFMKINNRTFSVLTGVEDLYPITMAAGGQGIVSGAASAIPEYFVALKAALGSADRDRAAYLNEQICNLYTALSVNNVVATYKAALKIKGVISTKNMRAPLAPLSDIEESILENVLNSNKYKEA